MLQVEHIQIKDQQGRYIIKGASFTLPNIGIVTIHGDNEILQHKLAQVLSGISKPFGGQLIYNQHTLSHFDEDERAMYRSTFAASLYHDFQILKNRTVFDNVTMGLEYLEDKVEEELKRWKLYDKRDVLAEDLSSSEQWCMVLVRYVLRQPMMLVIDTQSLPLSSIELQSFYPLLDELRSTMLIVILGDKHSYPFANRIIEFEEGYIISDSTKGEMMYPWISHNQEKFELTRSNIEDIHDTLHTFIRWKLRCASILCVAAFICLSTAIFSTTLNIIDVQMRLMNRQGSSIIAIEKQAIANDGSILDNYYDHLNDQDVHVLESKLSGNLTFGYYPADPEIAMLYTYGTSDPSIYKNRNVLDQYTIIEANEAADLGLAHIIGTYPQNYYEVALSSSQAYELLADVLDEPYQNTDEQNEKMLGQYVYWFNHVLRISGIFPSQDEANNNMELDMVGYNGTTYETGNMMQNSFFVRKGFHEAYPILQMKVYQKSYKRMIVASRIISSFEGLRSLETDTYYYNGKEFRVDHDLKRNEVLMDFDMALDMGFKDTYLQYINDENEIRYDKLIEEYKTFANTWINRTVTLQTYTVDNAPNSSMLMNEKVKIKGFIIPMRLTNHQTYHTDGQGAIYANSTLLDPYLSHNTYIKEAFYHSDRITDVKKVLNFLNQEKEYAAYLANSRILKFFVVDLKEITSFLMIIGSIFMLVFMIIFVFLLQAAIKYMRSEFSIYYLFGEKKSTLQKLILQYFQMMLWMRSLFGWFTGTLALAIFVFMIYFALSASHEILFSLGLPLLLLLGCIMILRIAFLIVMRKVKIIEEEFDDEIE